MEVETSQGYIAFMQDQGSATRLEWGDVRLFLALCRARSLGDAARGLGIDISTVSRRLAALEDNLTVTLFDRSRSGITATEAAERLLPVAEEIEHGMLRFAGEAESLERDVSGWVRLACPTDAAEVLVVPLLPSLLARHPGLHLDLLAGEKLVDVNRRDADLALRTARPEAGDLVVTKLLTITWRPAALPATVTALGRIKRWSDVPWIGCAEAFRHTTPGRWFQSELEGIEPVVRSPNLRVQIAAVEAGLGVALVPDRSLEHYGLAALNLAPKLRKCSWPEDTVYLVTHRSLRRIPRVAAVWDHFIENARGS